MIVFFFFLTTIFIYKLMHFFFQVKESDLLPKIICPCCYTFLVKWFETELKLKNAEKILKENRVRCLNFFFFFEIISRFCIITHGFQSNRYIKNTILNSAFSKEEKTVCLRLFSLFYAVDIREFKFRSNSIIERIDWIINTKPNAGLSRAERTKFINIKDKLYFVSGVF